MVNETKIYDDGVYIGALKDDKRHGQGRMTYNDGAVYNGEWKDNMWDGLGMLTFPGYKDGRGDIYLGQFKKGFFYGKGFFRWEDRDDRPGGLYIGEWRETGYGNAIMRWSNGQKFEGNCTEWLLYDRANADKWAGYGTMTYPDGRQETGRWVNGVFVDEPVKLRKDLKNLDGWQYRRCLNKPIENKINKYIKLPDKLQRTINQTFNIYNSMYEIDTIKNSDDLDNVINFGIAMIPIGFIPTDRIQAVWNL